MDQLGRSAGREPVRKEAVLIVNPTAGGGRATRATTGVVGELRDQGWLVEVAHSTDIENAEQIASDAAGAGVVVISLGGDGLAGRMAGAVAAHGGTLGVLPGGRGNDFVRALGLPPNPLAAAARLGRAATSWLDVGYVGDRSFLGIASAGLDSLVQERAARTPRIMGRATYGYALMGVLRHWSPAEFTISLDGAEQRVTGWNVAVANSGVYGGGMRMAPRASLYDGTLDVVSILECSSAHLLRAFPKVFAGTHLSDHAIRSWSASEVRISCADPFTLYADGEPLSSLPALVTVRPGALRILR